VRKAPAATIQDLVEALEIVAKKKAVEKRFIGIRHGEKEYESLLGSEERARSIDQGDYFKVGLDTRSLDYQIYFEKGQAFSDFEQSYTSHNTRRLSVEEIVNMISNLPEYRQYLSKGN
jgi:UDP-glucose 4-epimerase